MPPKITETCFSIVQRERNHCEQLLTFLLTVCARDVYVKTFLLPSCHWIFKNIQRQDGNKKVNELIGLVSKTTTLHVQFFVVFALLLCENA